MKKDNKITSSTFPFKTVRKSERSYKCPRCAGEYNHWDSDRRKPDKCPFCGLKKGQYNEEERPDTE